MDFLLHRGSAHSQLYVGITLTLLASQGLYSYNILYYQICFPSLHQIIFSTVFNILKYFPSLKKTFLKPLLPSSFSTIYRLCFVLGGLHVSPHFLLYRSQLRFNPMLTSTKKILHSTVHISPGMTVELFDSQPFPHPPQSEDVFFLS